MCCHRRLPVATDAPLYPAAAPAGNCAAAASGRLQAGVALDQFADTVAGEADGDLAILAIVFDVQDGADAERRMAHTRADGKPGGRPPPRRLHLGELFGGPRPGVAQQPGAG